MGIHSGRWDNVYKMGSGKRMGWRQKQAKYCDMRKRVLNERYSSTLSQAYLLPSLQNRHCADRVRFSEIYNRLLCETENMKVVYSPYINELFDRNFDEECERLNSIILNFKELEGWDENYVAPDYDKLHSQLNKERRMGQ